MMYKNSYSLRLALLVASITLSSFAGASVAAASVASTQARILAVIRANNLVTLRALMRQPGAQGVFASYKTRVHKLGIIAFARSIPRDLCVIAMLKKFGTALYTNQNEWVILMNSAKTRGEELQKLLREVQEEYFALHGIGASRGVKRTRAEATGASARRLAPIDTDLTEGVGEGPSSTLSAQVAVPEFVVDASGAEADVVMSEGSVGDSISDDEMYDGCAPTPPMEIEYSDAVIAETERLVGTEISSAPVTSASPSETLPRFDFGPPAVPVDVDDVYMHITCAGEPEL